MIFFMKYVTHMASIFYLSLVLLAILDLNCFCSMC